MKRLLPATLAVALTLPAGCGDRATSGASKLSEQPVTQAAPLLERRITPVRRWVEREPSHSPPARTGAAFAYDPTRNVSILYGGWGCAAGSCGILSDTWEWDGVDWTERTSTPTAGRVYNDAAFDYALGGVNVVGGSYTNTPANASHYWDGSDWIPTDMLPGFSLAARALVYENGASPRMLSFGGDDITSTVRDFTGTRTPGGSWTYSNPAQKPGARRDAKLVWDPVGDRSYLFGGRPCRMTESCQALADYWVISGNTWTDLGAGSRPSARFGHGFLYDAARGLGLMFGGRDAAQPNAELWQVEFPDTWTELAVSVSPEARSYFAFSYDSGRDVAVLFGGSTGATVPQGDTNPLGDTWELVLDFDSCASGSDCDSGFCVDGTCCEAAACGSCETCGDPTNPGVCTPVIDGPDADSCATTCDSVGQCESRCTTDKDCPGDCNACDAGSCVILTGAAEPGESCGSYLCDGVNPDCPDTCDDASGCVDGVPCNDSECTTRGGSCVDDSTCAGLSCVDGVCCQQACDVCGVCSVARGATRDGDCTPVPKGAPDAACALGCSGFDTTCLESAALPAGSPCSDSTDCLSGSCVAGACCAGSPAACQPASHSGPHALMRPHPMTAPVAPERRRSRELIALAPLCALALLLRRRQP
ncbi:MAG: hypothetical protein R3B07_21730 [Polyangiaceae bacterium]